MSDLTEAQQAMLRDARDVDFFGLRPGDNMWPLVEYTDPGIGGEEVDALVRSGLLACDEVGADFPTLPGVGDLPDLECRWRYATTPAGRAALARAGNL